MAVVACPCNVQVVAWVEVTVGIGRLLTLLAGVKVPSTSNKQMVFLIGLWSKVGITDTAAAAIVVVVFLDKVGIRALVCIWFP